MAIVTNRGTSQIGTTSNYRKRNTKCNYLHVNNINMTMTDGMDWWFLTGDVLG
jgi:hypothetical protein